MTTTTAKPAKESRLSRTAAALQSKGAPRAVGQAPIPSRRRPALIALGLALAILCGLGGYWIFSSASNAVTVLRVTSDVPRGAEITATDIGTLEIIDGQGTGAFTAEEADQVVGRIATVDLPSGTLVTEDNVGEGLPIEAGESVVGVALTAAQLPAYPIAAGDPVRIIETPLAQGDPPKTTPASYSATVFTRTFDEQTSQWIVDLVVPEDDAADIAARAATGRVALIVDAAEGQ